MEKNLFEPIPDILSHTIEDETTREQLASYGEALDKLVSIGTHLLSWEISGKQLIPVSLDEISVVSLFFRRILELIDSISVQIRNGQIVLYPAKIVG